MQVSGLIEGAEKVIDVLGQWPTFHDAEVISFSVERAIPVIVGTPLARLTVHVRRYVSVGEGTAQYQQVLAKSILVHFVFKGVSNLEVSDFNHQNVINAITVAPMEGDGDSRLVEIESIWGFGGCLRCTSSAVDRVEVLLNETA